MKKVAFLLCALLVGCASSQSITVMTYNIHHGEGTDANIDLPRLASVIKAAKADLVGLQEVDLVTARTGHVAQPDELARLTGMHVAFGSAMDFDGGKYGDAVLSRFPIESTRVVALPWQEGKEREPRCAVIVTCLLPHGRRVVFITTHFDHTREPSDRFLQAKALNDAAGRAGRSPAAILAGDFNCEVGSPAMKEIMSQWKLVSDADPTRTCPSDVPKEKIDHILVRPADAWRVVDVKVIDERVASDHRPVRVKLELK